MKFKFKSFSGPEKQSEDNPDAGENAPEQAKTPRQKRKDQLRKAQKTHRERKEAYLKSLEKEVLQLRTREANIVKENGDLHSENRILKELLAKNGIPLPSTAQQVCEDEALQSLFQINLSGYSSKAERPKMGAQRITSSKSPSDIQSYPSDGIPEAITTDTFSPLSLTSPESFGFAPQASPDIYLGNLDITAIGISFILSLEEPCLPHLLSNPTDFPSDHAHSLGATLIHPHITSLTSHHRHHPSTTSISTSSSSRNRHWQIHSRELSRLLELSSAITLSADELTPVQAWHQISQHPEIGEITLERLEGLRGKLAKGVVCYGFGGVINTEVFERCMFETFVVGRVF